MTSQPTQSPAVFTARKCAEARRVMLNAWGDQGFGRTYALDLMGIAPEHLNDGNLHFADQIRRTCTDSLAEATLYVADDDMTALVDVAAPTMPDQVLREDDMLSPHGFLWFAEPLPDRTGFGPQVPFRAIQWSLLAPGHPLLDRFAEDGPLQPDVDSEDGEDGEGTGGAPEPPYGVLIHTYSGTLEFANARMAYSRQPGTVKELAPGAPGIIPSASVVWMVGSPIGTAFGKSVEELRASSGVTEFGNDPGFYQRALAAFWTLAKQPLTTTEQTPSGSKPDRRRSARAGVKAPNEPVRVLRLRGNTGTGKDYSGGSGRSVSVRFAVRGHWRNQFLPSSRSHRQQWIAPYLKGPESAPLLGGERVFLAEGKGAALPEAGDRDLGG